MFPSCWADLKKVITPVVEWFLWKFFFLCILLFKSFLTIPIMGIESFYLSCFKQKKYLKQKEVANFTPDKKKKTSQNTNFAISSLVAISTWPLFLCWILLAKSFLTIPRIVGESLYLSCFEPKYIAITAEQIFKMSYLLL